MSFFIGEARCLFLSLRSPPLCHSFIYLLSFLFFFPLFSFLMNINSISSTGKFLPVFQRILATPIASRKKIVARAKFVCMVTRRRNPLRVSPYDASFKTQSIVSWTASLGGKKKKRKKEGSAFFTRSVIFNPLSGVGRRPTGNTTWNYVVELFNNTTTFRSRVPTYSPLSCERKRKTRQTRYNWGCTHPTERRG